MARLVLQSDTSRVKVVLEGDRQTLSFSTDIGHVVVSRRDGTFFVSDQADSTSTWIDGERLLPRTPAPLRDGCAVRLGSMDLLFFDEDERHRVCSPDRPCERFSDWWERAEEAPLDLPASRLLATADLCGTSYLQPWSNGPRQALAWYRAYLGDPHVERSCLPIPLPYLIDLGALIVSRQPPLRRWGRPGMSSRTDLRALYATAYQEQHLCVLAYRPALNFVRGRVAAAKAKDQAAVVARFLGDVFAWAAQAWVSEDCQDDRSAIDATFTRCSGRPRILSRPAEIQAFLMQLSALLQRRRGAFAEVVPPFERFLLGARARVASAFTDFDGPLINECLQSQNLEERDYLPDPLARLPVAPRVLSRSPGEHSSLNRVRKTNRLEKLPEVVPQDFALARVEPHGRRLLLEKLYQEGLLIWERHDYDVEVLRRRFLVCFVADIGPSAEVVGGAGDASALDLGEGPPRKEQGGPRLSSAGTHARRLIFECLRDLATFVRLPGGHLDVCTFLEPVGGRPESRLSWEVTLDELQARLGMGLSDDMVEVEELRRGDFFPRHAPSRQSLEPWRFINQAFEQGDYDLTLWVFFGPPRTLPTLLPIDPPRRGPRGQTAGARDVVRLVQLGRWPTAVEVARAARFEELSGGPVFGLCSDHELRYALLEELLGRHLASPAEAADLRLEGREEP